MMRLLARRNLRLSRLIALVIALLAIAAPPALTAEAIAMVNGQPIFREDLEWQWQRYRRQAEKTGLTAQPLPQSRRDLLDGLIRQEIAWQQAIAAGIAPDYPAIAREIGSLKEKFVDADALARELELLGLNEEQLLRQVEKTQVIRQWLDVTFLRPQLVTEEEILEWCRSYDAEFQPPDLPCTEMREKVIAKVRAVKARPQIDAFLETIRRTALVEIVEIP